MKVTRIGLLVASVVMSGILAFAAREVIYAVVVLPLSYAAWQLGVLLNAVPELVLWTALVVLTALVVVWQLVPELRRVRRGVLPARRELGQVGVAALWLQRSRSSNYFKWQVAHRLGTVWRQLHEFAGSGAVEVAPSAPIASYLDAGLNHSFVDFPARGRGLNGRQAMPLDLDAGQTIDYLESQLWTDRPSHADRL